MAELDLSILGKVERLVFDAMKIDVAKTKERESMRKKALDQLKVFKTKYSAYIKEIKSSAKESVGDLEKAFGIAKSELKTGHPLVVDLNNAIKKYKEIPTNPEYEQLDKAIDTIVDWDLSSEKQDSPVQSVLYIEKADDAFKTQRAAFKKGDDDIEKIIKAAKKDLDTVDDDDVKKKLKKILDSW